MSELKLCVLNHTVCVKKNMPQNADPSSSFWVVVDIFNEKRLLIPDFFVFKCYIARQPDSQPWAIWLKQTVGEHSKQNTAKCGS